MRLYQIGELKLLKEIRRRFSSANSSIIIGIGDDASVVAPQKEKTLITTDMMNEGVHFDLSFTSPFHLGFKLVSINVSDIAAMGGNPRYLFLNIAVKKDTDEDIFWSLYDGVSAAMNIYKLQLLGGDLCAIKNDMALSATIIGSGDKILTRSGASIGDKIYVTGFLGNSACGLEMLQQLTDESRNRVKSLGFGVKNKENERIRGWDDKKDSTSQPLKLSTSQVINWDTAEPLIGRHLMPVARNCSEFLPYATSMIDISDGLFIDLCRICEENGVGAKVYIDKIPVSKELKHASEIMNLDSLQLATSGGEDYELLFTAPANCKVQTAEKVTYIGEIVEKERVVVDMAGRETAMKPKGYQHFGSS